MILISAVYSVVVGGKREIFSLRITQDPSQGRAWLTVWLTHTTEAWVSRAGELLWSPLIILARVSIWVSQKEKETEGVRTDLLHHPSATNEAITAPVCPSAIQKH